MSYVEWLWVWKIFLKVSLSYAKVSGYKKCDGIKWVVKLKYEAWGRLLTFLIKYGRID